MLVECGVMGFDEIFEPFLTAESILQDGELLCRCGFEFGKGIGGAHNGFCGVESCLGFCGVASLNLYLFKTS